MVHAFAALIVALAGEGFKCFDGVGRAVLTFRLLRVAAGNSRNDRFSLHSGSVRGDGWL